jgi:hypothetical protein
MLRAIYMRILNLIGKFLVEMTMDDDERNVKKGHKFEKYVVSLFTKQENYFSIIEWTTDIYDKSKNIKVESNKNPDLVILYKPTKEKFAVECKFRSGPFQSDKYKEDVLKWSYPDQIRRYNTYSAKNKIPLFIVIGYGGLPDKPEKMFCLPIQDAQYPELFLSYLENFARSPTKPFFYKNKMLY